MKISKQAFLAAWENQKLVRGALKTAHVRRDYNNYDDLLQEGIFVYATELAQGQPLTREEIDRRSFRKIIWRTLDLLRKNQLVQERQTDLLAAQNLRQMHSWDNYLALEKEIPQMTALEAVIFYRHLLAGETITEIAAASGVTRVQLQRIKRRLINHLRQTLEISSNFL
ncbi:sigma-70 family RNA polymerase sigma factor [Lactobacillus sp. ESL0785]|uniref:sigma-70 family RNA polymerase sigma factor n=1 Tax=Lactobacillus sp. ESL0785 TaxID=2983232 RepID=UPI0023F91438|nr:sigma-70 family RNA polymerase sigma factor [Lactobacillus sp. ESL0785]WEV70753.1 sigma-70 family RNA polymerase sigma factor [Lactobacillus sp. ESL0785]